MIDYKTVFQLAQDKGCPKLGWSTADEKFLKLCLLQKWLRDEHKIFVSINYVSGLFWIEVVQNNNNKLPLGKNKHSYESALLSGIHEALKLI